MKRILTIVTALLASLLASAGGPYEGTDPVTAYLSIEEAFRGRTDMSVPELTVEVALHLLGTPYVGGTLEKVPEELIVRYDATDCILFVETCIATALTLKGIDLSRGEPGAAEPSYALLKENIRMLRYRDGHIGYSTREHYTSGWLSNAEKLGVLKEYSARIGEPLQQTFSFMSTHPASYPQLASDTAMVSRIRAVEKELESGSYAWVPASRISSVEDSICTGDIVCYVTKVKGLDISHVALAYEKDGRMCFIHASSAARKVIIDDRTIASYASYGVRLARLDSIE